MQGFKNWLFRQFVPNCDTQTRNAMMTSLRKTHSAKSKATAESGTLNAQFGDWASKDGRLRKSPRDILMALDDFKTQVSLDRHVSLLDEDAVNFWKQKVSLSHGDGERPALPLEHLLQTYHASERATLVGRVGRRFTVLLVVQQVEAFLEEAQAEERLSMSDTISNVAQAVQDLSASHDLDVGTINECRRDGAGWLRFIEEWGFGAIMLPVKEGNLFVLSPQSCFIINILERIELTPGVTDMKSKLVRKTSSLCIVFVSRSGKTYQLRFLHLTMLPGGSFGKRLLG
jgi:hypothetical protein